MAVARNSPLLAQVEVTPLLLDVLPPADSLHQAAPKTGKHLIIIVEVGTFVFRCRSGRPNRTFESHPPLHGPKDTGQSSD